MSSKLTGSILVSIKLHSSKIVQLLNVFYAIAHGRINFFRFYQTESRINLYDIFQLYKLNYKMQLKPFHET